MRIYIASSWRNSIQPWIVKRLESAGHYVYDFRNPMQGNDGFHWSDIDPAWKQWGPREFRHHLLSHDLAADSFQYDWRAMQWADACVLVLPCGRSAHLEAGYFVGAGKRLVILLADGEPELMYRMAGDICTSIDEVIDALARDVPPEVEHLVEA